MGDKWDDSTAKKIVHGLKMGTSSSVTDASSHQDNADTADANTANTGSQELIFYENHFSVNERSLDPAKMSHKGSENDDFVYVPLSVDETSATNVMDGNDGRYCNDLSGPGGVSKDDISKTGGATKGGLSMSGGAAKDGLFMSGGAAKDGLSMSGGAAKDGLSMSGGAAKGGLSMSGGAAKGGLSMSGGAAKDGLSMSGGAAKGGLSMSGGATKGGLSMSGGATKGGLSNTGGAAKDGLSISGGAAKDGLSMSGGASKGGLSNTGGAAKGEIPETGGTSKDKDKTELLVPDIWQNFSITVGKGEKESLSGELSPTKMQYLITKNWPQIKSEVGMSVTYEVNKNDCNLTVGDSTGRQSGEDILSGLVEYFKALLQTTSQIMVNIQDLDEGFLMFIGTSLYKHVQDKDAYIAYNKRGKEMVITGNISNIRRCQRVIEKGMKEYKNVGHKKLNLGSQKVELLKKSELLKKEKIMSKCKVDINESEGSILLTGSLKDIEQCEQFVTEFLQKFRSIQRKLETGVQILLSYQETANWINEQLLSKDLDVVWEVTNDGLLEIQGLTTDLCKAAASFILCITSPVKVDKNIPYDNASLIKLFAEHNKHKLYYDTNTEQCYATDDVRNQILDILEKDIQREAKGNLVMTQKSHTPQLKFTGDTQSGGGSADKILVTTGRFTGKEKQFCLPDLAFELLKYKETQEYFNKLLKEEGIHCSWSMTQMQGKHVLLVKESNEAKCDKVGKIFSDNICEREFLSEAYFKKLPQSENLKKQFSGKFVFSDLEHEEFSVVATSDVIETLSDAINTLLDSLCMEKFRISPQKAQYLQEIGKGYIDNVRDQLVVAIDCSKSGSIEIYGKRQDVPSAKKALEDIIDKICIEKIVEDGQVFTECSEDQDTDMKSLERHCVIQTREFNRHEEPLHVCNWILDSMFFCLMKGSPVDVTADMIVCPTNTSLFPIAGGKEIIEESGNEPLDETQKFMSKHGAQLKPGKHYISSIVGDLNFQFICHLPTESNEERADPIQIDQWLQNMFLEADKSGVQSIVLPVLLSSTSKLSVVVRQIATAVCVYGQQKHPNLNEIYVTVEDDDDICFDVTKILKEEISKLQNVVLYDFQLLLPSQKEDTRRSDIKINITEGSLVDQKVDVLVNTTGTDLNLSRGFVSSTLLRAAGKAIQDECQRQKPDGLSKGDVIMTSSGDMKTCKKICHGVLPQWIPRTNLSLRILKLFMWQCLSHTQNSMYSNIAFPVLGTGKLEYPWRQVAKIMIECIEEFGRENSETSVKEVRIIMYHEDKDVINAFQIVQRERRNKIPATEVHQILESHKTTRTGNKKVLLTYVKDMTMCDCEMVVFLTPGDGASSTDPGRIFSSDKDGECLTFRCEWDNSQESLIDIIQSATRVGETHRVQSMAFLIRDCSEKSQTKKWKMKETIQLIKVEIFQARLKYLQVVKVCVPTMEILQQIIQKTKKNRLEEIASKLSAAFGSIMGNKPDVPAWNIVKTRKLLEKQRSVKITLVGTRSDIEEVQRKLQIKFKKIKSKTVSRPNTYEASHGVGKFYIDTQQQCSVTCVQLLPSDIIDALNKGVKDGGMTVHVGDTVYDLNFMVCHPEKYTMKTTAIYTADTVQNEGFKVVKENAAPKDKDAILDAGADIDDDEIFYDVTAELNPPIFRPQKDTQNMKADLEKNFKVQIKNDSQNRIFVCANSLDELQDVNSTFLQDKQDEQMVQDQGLTLTMDEKEYKIFLFFAEDKKWFKDLGNSLKFQSGELHIPTDDKEVQEEIRKHEKEIQELNSHDYPLEKTDFEKAPDVCHHLQKDYKDVHIYFKEDANLILLTTNSYNSYLTAKHKIDVSLGRVKETSRDRNRRFEKKKDNESNQMPTTPPPSYGATAPPISEASETRSFAPVQGCLKPIGRFPGEYKTQEGILVKVYSGSITSLSVDCIVNAANEQLAHGGGVAYAISRAAGYEFDRESREYIQKNGYLNVGECCTTSAGNLNYACVIHTVGPRWSGYRDKSQCLDILKQSVEVTFIEAERLKLNSVAVPAISSGIFGVPKRDCAEQYYRAVISYSQNRSNTNLKEIHFVDIDPGMISVIQNTFGEMIKNYSGDTSQNGVNNSTICTNQGTRNNVDVTTLSMNLRHGQLKFRASDNIEVLLYQGKIEETKVEAVVCPQDKKFSGSGQIAKAILEAVDGVHGEDAVKSLKSSTKNGYISEVRVLKAESVASHWNYILHAVCPRWNEHAIKDPKSYKTDLYRTLWNCLDAVTEWKINSVAFPLLGAAIQPLATPLDICAKCLTEAISRTQFFQPVEIHVVCYDQSALDAYQKFLSEKFEKITSPIPDVQEAGKTSFSRAGRSFPAKQEGYDTEQIDDKTPTITADCCICIDTATNPKTLSKCGHTFCSDCIDQYFKGYKPVCPNCGQVYGKVKGDQPDGQIYITKSHVSLPGHEGSGSIKVTYSFKDGKQGPDHPSPGKQYQGIERSGHLPDNTKGRIVAKLLNVAFTRRLVFTIGRSRTTGQEGVLTWNDIHHKTRTHGGPERFGYPDPTYLDRVLDELAVKGVTEESADDPNEYRRFAICFRY